MSDLFSLTPRFALLTALALAGLAGCAHTALAPGASPTTPSPELRLSAHDESPRAWFESGAAAAAARGAGQASARNLILFVGDGMGPTTVAAARILDGQRRGATGEENLLGFEAFPHTGYSKTYNTDLQTPDSAGTMSAMMSGVKTRAGVIGLDGSARYGDCASARGAELPSLLQLAEAAGLATGVVTTTRVTHATPAATYAHTPHRDWEADALVPAADRTACADIARQLIEFDHGDGIEVVMGGGRQMFLPATASDPEYPDTRGLREDGRDLVAEWQRRHPQGHYAWNRAGFEAIDFATADKVFALFQPGHMQYEHDRPTDVAGEPSLAEMVAAAITRLQRSEQGFLLVVEAGRIDHAHHANNAYRALTDTIALSEAVAAARAATSIEDTLILVTADHSHVLSFAGYSHRGNPILGKVTDRTGSDDVVLKRDMTGRVFTTLGYLNGPGYAAASDLQPEGVKRQPHEPARFEARDVRPDLENVDTSDPDFLQPSLWALKSETHGGEDVGVYAIGPGAEAVRGVMEQNVIFHLLLQAQPALRAQAQHAGPR
ncbi:alkaline phosphatase [Aquimonas voraii]|uniref:Alkaline phosphatase n=1 Tax=Aquimonas voraii TaxID=265719 RepID=A0A1G7ADP1_9GAMM|nr:alkaline phosphatase [Aquimonas voraii]SDE13058.1 alkaline phosphatase [Aquimonas voraii]